MVAFILNIFGEGFRMPVAHHIKLTTHDRLYDRFQNVFPFLIFTHHFGILPSLTHKIESTEHVPVIGDGQCRHSILDGFLIQ